MYIILYMKTKWDSFRIKGIKEKDREKEKVK